MGQSQSAPEQVRDGFRNQTGRADSRFWNNEKLQTTTTTCPGTFESITAIFKNGRDGDNYLKPHRPDRPDMYLVNYSSVVNCYEKQADAMLQRNGQSCDEAKSSATAPIGQPENQSSNQMKMTALLCATGCSAAPVSEEVLVLEQKEREMIGRVQANMSLIDEWRSKQQKAKMEKDDENTFTSDEGSGNSILQSPHARLRAILELEDVQERRRPHMQAIGLQLKTSLIEFYKVEYLQKFPDSNYAAIFGGIPNPTLPSWNGVVPQLAPSDESSTNSLDAQDAGSRNPISLTVDGSSFMNLVFTGSLGLSSEARKSDQVVESNQKSPDHYLVLRDAARNTPVAVMAAKAANGPPIVRIYAPKRRVSGQKASATTSDLGLDSFSCDNSLYAWAEIVTRGKFSAGRILFDLYMATGSNGQFSKFPSYQTSFNITGTSTRIEITGKTDQDTTDFGCALLSFGKMKRHGKASMQLEVASGIDPALMLCLAASLAEVVEAGMKKQCRKTQRIAI